MYKMSNGNLNIKNKFQRDKKQLIADVILWIIMCIIYIAFWKQNLMYSIKDCYYYISFYCRKYRNINQRQNPTKI